MLTFYRTHTQTHHKQASMETIIATPTGTHTWFTAYASDATVNLNQPIGTGQRSLTDCCRGDVTKVKGDIHPNYAVFEKSMGKFTWNVWSISHCTLLINAIESNFISRSDKIRFVPQLSSSDVPLNKSKSNCFHVWTWFSHHQLAER